MYAVRSTVDVPPKRLRSYFRATGLCSWEKDDGPIVYFSTLAQAKQALKLPLPKTEIDVSDKREIVRVSWGLKGQNGRLVLRLPTPRTALRMRLSTEKVVRVVRRVRLK